jgi:hypothetical protein
MQIFVKTRACPPGTRRARPPSHLPDRRVSAAWLFLGCGISPSLGRDRLLVPGSRGRPEPLPRGLRAPRPPRHSIAAAPRATGAPSPVRRPSR